MPDAAPDAGARADLAAARRIVVKIGSSVLASLSEGVDHARIRAIADDAAALREAGREVVLVSSGAVAAGAARLGMTERPADLARQQAAAAVGQGKLMRYYAEAFAGRGLAVGQMLLTRDGLDDRRRYLNARTTLRALLEFGAVPVVNENDTVMVEEIQFGDNDTLSAMVAIMAEADALVLLSDVDGLHERPPAEGESPLLADVPAITPAVEALAGLGGGGLGRGGMASKILAAERATRAGIPTVIARGAAERILARVAAGEAVGTRFAPASATASAKKHWLAGRRPAGAIRVDDGARRAVVEQGKSLLPIGMIDADRAIATGDTVRLVGEDGVEFARGISNFDGEALGRIARRRTEELPALLGGACADTVVHRDNLLVTDRAARS